MKELLRREEITILDIRALAASIYEPQARLWMGGKWFCPQCLKANEGELRQCACGISRDGLPEFRERPPCQFPGN